VIDRYEVAAIARIWSEENKYRKWLDVELAVTETWAEMGQVPASSLKNIRRHAAFDCGRIREIEKKVKHDVIAFLTSVEESIGSDSAYVHKGITSYDIVDTALSLLIQESLDVVLAGCQELKRVLLDKAFAYRDLPAIGRTHGIHAEPIAFGCKFLIWHEEMERDRQRLLRAKETMAVGKISGSVGTYIHFPAAAEEKALRRLGLKACRISSQIIQRDRHAEVIASLALLGTTLEKIAVEIRHLQKTEVLEAEEPFTRGQKGSSSMPHKRNPVRCERVSGLARVLRGHATVALENNVLWHERDISHSSAERIIFPDSFHLAVFMLEDLADVMRNLVVYPENIRRNLELTQGVYFSQKVLTLLVDKGLARQRAYELVQALAMRSWREKRSFRELVLADPAITALCPAAELERAFSLQDLLAGTRDIFKRFARKK
jgi:adenylosuccinate lyase